MRRSKSTVRLGRLQQLRAGFPGYLLAHKLKLFWGLAVVWIIYLALSTGRRPAQLAYRHSRSLLEASALTGRLEALDFGQHPADSLREAVQKAISPDFGYLRFREGEEGDQGEYDPLLKSIESITTQLLAAEDIVHCAWDPSLETNLRQLKTHKYLLAANFHNNEELLPHVIVQLWHLLAILPKGSVFLSIYESDSDDSTGAWLEVLRQLVTAMHIPHRIVVGGNLTRAEDQERIDFLAEVRNAALEPLWSDTVSDGGMPSNWIHEEPVREEKAWPADRVVFMNDVYFCAKDVIRLLLHNADMACGMDFDRKKLDQIPKEEQRHHLGKFLHKKMGLPTFVGEVLGLMQPMLTLQEKSEAANELFRRDLPMGFYDLWVGRDANGAMFLKEQPYATDPYTLQRLPWGLPFPVKCCWNGLVALNAAPFTRHAVKIRSHREGECAASECSLLCNDYLRLGYQNMVVDPGVRQAYNVRDARDLYQPKWVKGINVTLWGDVTSAVPIEPRLVPFRPFSQCCGLKSGNNMIDFKEDCGWENFMYPNFTAMPDRPRTPAKNQSAHQPSYISARSARHQRLGKRRLDTVSVTLESSVGHSSGRAARSWGHKRS